MAIQISKFSSVQFINKQYSFYDEEVCYMQKFGLNDTIRIQFTAEYQPEYYYLKVSDVYGKTISQVQFEDIYYFSHISIYECVYPLSSLIEGNIFRLSIVNENEEITHTHICILPKEELHKTILIECTNYANDYDAIFLPEKKFQFRVEGGIYQANAKQNVDNETFRDQLSSLHQLSAFPYEVNVLTIGNSNGVPQWVGNKINYIFSLSSVYVNNKETVRSEGSIPELVQLQPYYPLYVFNMDIEQKDANIQVMKNTYIVSNNNTYIASNGNNKLLANTIIH